tara:strand:+ start:689 stop:1408 length:720 start_codon:yes stop_codon:yes gene_type:complete
MDPLFDEGSSIPPYVWLAAAAISISLFFWFRLTKRNWKLMVVYVGALVGGLLGAKLTFLAAEGWMYYNTPGWSEQLLRGKTVLGALLSGYLSVEIVKRIVGLHHPTGDFFATVVPLALIVARFGCLAQGCCLGVPQPESWHTLTDQSGVSRWPAVPAEIIFNLICLVVLNTMRREKILPGQHFHLYLIAYGLFRFLHEFVRATPRLFGPVSGYHIAALLVALLGLIGFLKRRPKASALA